MTTTPVPLDPAATALLLMDFQAGVLGRLPGANELRQKARDVIALSRSRGVTIGYVRIAFAAGEVPGGRMGRLLTPELLAAVQVDSPATQIDAQLAPQAGDIVVRKVRVGPFGTTDLDTQLRDRGIDTLLLAGLTTSGVVLTAVRDAHDRDYRVVIVSDLTADPDAEIRTFLLERIFPLQGEVVRSEDLASLFGEHTVTR